MEYKVRLLQNHNYTRKEINASEEIVPTLKKEIKNINDIIDTLNSDKEVVIKKL